MTTWGTGIAAAAKSGSTVLVTVGGVDTAMQAPRDLTIADGDRVAYIRSGSNWFVVQRYDLAAVADQPDNPVPPPVKPTSVTGTRTFTPVETRTYRGSAWRTTDDDAYQGEFASTGLNTGCAFYGSGPRSLAGATVDAARIRVRRRDSGGDAGAQATTLHLVTEATRPSGAPTLTSSTAGPSLDLRQAATFTIPTGWAQDVVDGAAGGLAVYDADGSPYLILEGLGRYTAAFSLSIDYTRTI